ncbi:MAG: hypothetical protein JST58_10870 [Bacteroidetes bacterium]|nr:hypothetical protein [Bacteroidota bacterium]
MKKGLLPFLIAGIVIFISCQKNSIKSQNASLTGTWALVSLNAETQVISQYTNLGIVLTDITSAEYTSSDNTGLVNFSNGTATITNIGYTVSTDVFYENYQNKVLVDTFYAAFSKVFNPTNSSNPFKVITVDSISFNGGGILSPANLPEAVSQAMVSGFKFNINGNILTLTAHLNNTTSGNVSGMPATFNESAIYTIILSKQ